MMVLVAGLPGSGKTYFAKRLAPRISAVRLSSDDVRRVLKATGKYQSADRMRVYTELARLAEMRLTKRETVIIDATFSQRNMRDLFTSLAKKLSVPLYFIWVYADEKLIQERVQQSRKDSEADFTVYQKIRDQFELLDPPFLRIESTNSNIETMLETAERYIRGDE